MSHALIIDDNMLVSQAVQQKLMPLGFSSFDHSWTEAQAIAAAKRRIPDLLIVGDSLESGSPMNAARQIVEAYGVPAIVVTADRLRAGNRLPDDAMLSGPFKLEQMTDAVTAARIA